MRRDHLDSSGEVAHEAEVRQGLVLPQESKIAGHVLRGERNHNGLPHISSFRAPKKLRNSP